MIKIIIYLFFLFNVVHLNPSIAATYYISNSGVDNNDGLSPVSSWKTISKLNSMMTKLRPGDAVFFERGGYFIGQINLNASGDDSNPLIFGAYGEGRNPVISGSMLIKNWNVYKKGIYTAEVNTNVKNLFLNGEQMILARYPNSGYLTIDKPITNSKKGLIDNELNQATGFWNGSIARIRTVNWAYEYSQVKKFKNGSLIFETPTFYPVQAGWGYYLDNNLNVLDTSKEWYFLKRNETNGDVYIYPPSNVSVDNSLIEGSVYNFGFYSSENLTNIIFRNMNIRHQSNSGIFLNGKNSRIKIENCTFTGQFECGISIEGVSKNIEISICRFYNINGKGVYLLNCSGNIISNSIFRNIGMVPGYGTTGDSFPMSSIIVLKSNSTHIIWNNIRNVGHDGINCVGTENTIEKNVISNTMLYLNDGGAIKSYGQNTGNSVWKNNFISNVYGNLNGTLIRNNTISASGIYLDEYCNNIKVLNNTILNCELAGINLYNGGRSNLFEGNVSYGNNIGIRFFQEELPMIGNLVKNNIFFGLTNAQIAVRLKTRSNLFFPGVFGENYYFNYAKDGLFQYEVGTNITEYNFAQWQKLIGLNSDLNSKVLSGNEIKYSKLFSNMSDDSLIIPLNSYVLYKDKNFNSANDSVVLQPWTSQIFFTNSDISNFPEINVAGGRIDFDNKKLKSLAPQWVNLKADNLNSQLIIKAPEGFEISLSEDNDFTNSIFLDHVNGKIDRIIFVRFKPESDKVYYDYITISGGNFYSKIKVKGNSR